jgi:hypothetical protein
MEGKKLGIALMSEVPVIKEMYHALMDFFNPSRFQNLAAKMRGVILNFFKGNGSVSDVMGDAQAAFTEFFTETSPAVKAMLEGAKKILIRVSGAIGQGVEYLTKQLAIGMGYIVDLLSGKKMGDLAAAGTLAGDSLGFLQEILAPIMKSLEKSWPILADSFSKLIYVALTKLYEAISTDPIKTTLTNIAMKVALVLGTVIAGRAILGAISGAMANAVVGGIAGLARRSIASRISAAASQAASATTQVGASGATQAGAQAAGAGKTMMEGWVAAAIKARKIQFTDLVKLAGLLLVIGGSVAAGLVMVGYGLVEALRVLKPLLTDDRTVVAMFGLLAALIGGTAIAAQASRGVDVKQVMTVFGLMAAIAFGLRLAGPMLGTGLAGMMDAMEGVDLNAIVPVMFGLGALLTMTAVAAQASRGTNPGAVATLGGVMLALGTALAFGGAQLGAGVSAFTKALAGLSYEELTKSIISLTAVVLNVAILGLAAAAMGAMSSQMANMAIGGAVILVLAAGMVGLLALLSLVLKTGVTASQYKDLADAMLSVSLTMLALVPVILAAAGLGALLAGPQALALAGVPLGLAAMSAGVVGIAKFTVVIMDQLNNMKFDPSLKQKIDIFLSVLDAMTKMMKIMSDVLKDMIPSMSEVLLQIVGGKVPDRLGEFNKYLTNIGPAIKDITDSAMTLINSIKSGMSDSMIKGAETVASILSSIATLMQSSVPPQGMLDSQEQEWGFFGGKVKTVSTSFVTYMAEARDSLSLVFKETKDLIDKMGSVELTDAQLKGVQGMSSMLGSIAQIMKVMIPDGQVMGSLQKSFEKSRTTGWGKLPDISEKSSGVDSEALKMFLDNSKESFGKVIDLLSNDQFKAFMEKAGNFIKTPQQAKSIEILSKLLTTVGSMIGGLSTASGSSSTMKNGATEINVTQSGSTMLVAALDKMVAKDGGIKQLFDRLIEVSGLISNMKFDPKTFSDKFKALTTVFELVNKVSTFLNQAAEKGPGGSEGEKAKDLITKSGIMPSLAAIEEMVKLVNVMQDQLSSISLGKKTVTAGLTKIASELGVGGKARFEINNKPISITLGIEIRMTASDVEKAIVFRKESVIRDQLKWIRNSKPSEDAFKQGSTSDLDVGNRSSAYVPHSP